MSDTFDPDAWPHSPSGSSRPEGPTPHDEDDDDYDSFDLSQTSGAYGDEDDDDDYNSAAFGAPTGPRAPGAGAYGDEDDEDDYDSPGYGTSYAAPAAPGTDYEDDYNYDEPARTGRSQSQTDDDDYDNSYGNYDSYDDEDPYNAYDDDSSGGGARKLILGALAVVIVLIVLGVGFSLLGGKKGANNNAAQGNTPTTAKPNTPTSTGTQAVPPTDAVNGLNQALTAWGKFAIDGNLNDVKPYFVSGTDQYNQFVAEAPQIQARNVGGAPLAMTMSNATTVKDNDNEWDFKGTVAVTRTGEQAQTFPWDIQIIRQNAGQPWQVESVRQYQA